MKQFELDNLPSDFFKSSSYIKASAGTGKTYSIENLVVKLLAADPKDLCGEAPLDLSQILIVTFTDKAAAELRYRVGRILRKCQSPAANEIDRAPIFTFHAFCKKVLDEYSFEANSFTGASLLNDGNSLWDLVERECRDVWKNDEEFLKLTGEITPSDLIEKITLLADEYKRGDVEMFWNVESAQTDFEKFCQRIVPDIQQKWTAQKLRNKELTFDDLIASIQAECEKPDSPLLKLLRKKFRYAIIDEFQDTNRSQWSIFKNIFLNEDHVIYVVGDPKQAIFGFQGSNIKVYQHALGQFGAEQDVGYQLTKNYRSADHMIKACNALSRELIGESFEDSEFGKADDKFCAQQLVGRKFENVTAPFHICRIEGDKTKEVAKKEYYRWILKKIKELQVGTDKCTVQIPDKEKESGNYRAINYSDITVLGRTSDELKSVERLLKKEGIPCSRYKDPTLFEGIATAHWAALLSAIDNVNARTKTAVSAIRSSMLTYFFDMDLRVVQEVKDFDDPTEESVLKATQLLKEFYKVAQKKDWGAFVEKILRKTGVEERCAQRGDTELLAKFRQLADYICDTLYSENISLAKLSRHLLQVQNEERDAMGKDGNIIGADSDVPQIKLMTMHVAKGLQFPIVFIAGAISLDRYKKNKTAVYFADADSVNRTLVEKSFSTWRGIQPTLNTQDAEEKKRLLYVAITRAEFLCYAPVFDASFWQVAVDNALSKAVQFFTEHKISFSKVEDESAEETPQEEVAGFDAKKAALITRQAAAVQHLNETLTSLSDVPSNMHKAHILSTQASSYSALMRYKKQVEEDLESGATDFEDNMKLPAGAHVGNAFHHILEVIDFKAAKEMFNPFGTAELEGDKLAESYATLPEHLRQLIEINMRGEGVNTKFAPQFALVIYHVMNAKVALPKTGEVICLGDLEPSCRRHEMNFDMNTTMAKSDVLYSHKGSESLVQFNGSIDLLFKHKDLWYVLDWKSNRLDYGLAYDSKNIYNNMLHHKYDLQCALYTEVLLKWMGNFRAKTGVTQPTDKQVFDENFGGVIYCYLRGCRKDQNTGLYITNWDGDFSKFESDLNKSVNAPYVNFVTQKEETGKDDDAE